jgi:hypothetical protein
MKADFNMALQAKVIEFDFIKNRLNKELLEQLTKSDENTIVLSMFDPGNGEAIGIVQALFNKKSRSALLSVIPLNPRYVPDGEAWMVHILPDVIEYLAGIGQIQTVYTNLHPTWCEAIEGYLQFGFQRMKNKECFKTKDVVYVSLRYRY